MTADPAQTTLLQSISTREDSENKLKWDLKSFNDWTVAGEPLFRRASSGRASRYFSFSAVDSLASSLARMVKGSVSKTETTCFSAAAE